MTSCDEKQPKQSSTSAAFTCPEDLLWGFHLHCEAQTTNAADVASMLLVHRAAEMFLRTANAPIVASACFNNAGPPYDYNVTQNLSNYAIHVSPSCEVRVEVPPSSDMEKRRMVAATNIFPLLGKTLLYITAEESRRGLGSYIHPITHDESLPLLECMKQEHEEHENTLYAGKRTFLDLSFFLKPPRDEGGKLIDTRVPNLMGDDKKREYVARSTKEFAEPTRDFARLAGDGVKFVVHFSGRSVPQRQAALDLYAHLKSYLAACESLPEEMDIELSDKLFDGVIFVNYVADKTTFTDKNKEDDFLTKIGRLTAYLMINRRALDVSIIAGSGCHPGLERALRSRHVIELSQGYAFMGSPPPIGGRTVKWNVSSAADGDR